MNSGRTALVVTRATEPIVCSGVDELEEAAVELHTLCGFDVSAKEVRPARPAFGWDSLTSAELAVAELVTAGLTNPEVGTLLYVSRRTVESHLAHIFRKLDLVSRTQLATEFTRRELAKLSV